MVYQNFPRETLLSVGDNHMKIHSIVLEFIANRQTDAVRDLVL